MHIPFISPIVLIIAVGLGFLIADKLVSKSLKKDRVIMGGIDRALKKISGDNILIELAIILGIPVAAFFLLDLFHDDSVWYWIIVGIELTPFAYLGAKWWENL